ncbi:nucleotide exchange factor GrpE [Nocardia huaxiensis]|uniref:Nucleotide exchange factor GrpE n=1 Tax=Nocardia huaxiensis TaxID=2755382 RepID=A0A7D6VCN7_9NOCA|nr:nucleotide exchange factor GrpE [Nocardia huaxiensis]QLY29717.1 nucleotide exchange factor GrpE [Nocardia huaxiensis]UFS96706.1 nucleotide exchange factor GrpE [Nocardia huaxiensis]
MTESAAATGHSDTTGEPTATEAAAPDSGEPDTPFSLGPTDPVDALAERLTERIDDLARVIARQGSALDRLADDAKARAQRERAGADVPLVVELFALYGDAQALGTTAHSEAERTAFETFANRVERLLTGRGGQLVLPAPGAVFDALTMEAADVVDTEDAAADRTVEDVLQPGLTIAERSVRPAKVIVRRHRAASE